MSKVKIGELFLRGECFADEANQTIGAPALSEEVFLNRRRVTSRLTEEGKAAKKLVIEHFKSEYGLDIKLRWSAYCGCSMCPCSPGFNIIVEGASQWRPRGSSCLDVSVNAGKVEVKVPKNSDPFRWVKAV